MNRRGFLTAGTWCLDRNLTIGHWPREDTVARVSGKELSGGGNGCNFACDIKRLDNSVPVETQGVISDDTDGHYLRAVARDHGIIDGLTILPGAQTQVTDAYQSLESGLRTHITSLGVADDLCPDHFDFSTTTARVLHLGLPGIHKTMDARWNDDENGWVTTLKAARAVGMETNLELVSVVPERLRQIVLPCLPHLTTLVVNDFEIGALTEHQTLPDGTTDLAACEQAARKACALGSVELCVVHFTRGALLIRPGETAVHVPSVNVPDREIIGANGAGDAFAAGFFLGRHRDLPDADCLRLGHAAAATSLLGLGTYSAMENAGACLARAEAWGWRG